MYALESFGFGFRRSNISNNDKNILYIRQKHVLVEFLHTNMGTVLGRSRAVHPV